MQTGEKQKAVQEKDEFRRTKFQSHGLRSHTENQGFRIITGNGKFVLVRDFVENILTIELLK